MRVRFFVPFSFNAKMMVSGEPHPINPPTMREPPSLILSAASFADITGFTIIGYPFVFIVDLVNEI
jgi:hypothetical protein